MPRNVKTLMLILMESIARVEHEMFTYKMQLYIVVDNVHQMSI